MRQILTLLISIIFISSCSEVRFSQPQPQNGKALNEFPKQFTGKYLSADGDTLVINSKCFHYIDEEDKKLCSDSVTLKKKGGVYILSCKELMISGVDMKRDGWEVLPFELVEDTLVVYFLNTTTKDVSVETISKLEDILDIEKKLNDDGKVEYYYIDPTIKQFEKMLSSQCFSVAEKFIRIN